MFGAELSEFLIFVKQFGVALAGAAALWGAYFSYKTHKHEQKNDCLVYDWIAEKLLIPFLIGILVAAVVWITLAFIFPAFAHEGIVLTPTYTERSTAATFATPIFVVWLFYILGGVISRRRDKESFQRNLGRFFMINFVFALVLASLPAVGESIDNRQLFFIGHSAHSIFTLGTVLILDFLFIISRKSTILKQHLYPAFTTLSKVIWVGLGFDFLSVGLVFNEAIQLTPKFFFMQTVIGVLIINGVLLSGPLSRKLLNSVEQGGEKLTRKWLKIADVAGTVSISSWFLNTFVDSFENLTLTYSQFLVIYLSVIAILFFGHQMVEHFTLDEPEFV